MGPKHAPYGREFGPRQAFEHAWMIPELELDDVGLARQRGDLRKTFSDQHARAGSLDLIDVATLARRLEQNEGLLHNLRQDRAQCRVRFADTTAQMRRDVQDSHSAATAANRRLLPPGGSRLGSIATRDLNLSSSIGRCASMLSGRQWLNCPQLPQTWFCLRLPSRCCSRSAFIASEVQIDFIDWVRTSPMTSLRPQSRKQELTSPSAFTE